jgi:hypothetical protein
VCGRGKSSREGAFAGPNNNKKIVIGWQAAGSERDVDEVRKEGGKTVLEKVCQRKVAMPKKKKYHVTCLETFSVAGVRLVLLLPLSVWTSPKAKFCSSFLSSDYK